MCTVNIVPTLKGQKYQCVLRIVTAGITVIAFEQLSKIIDLVSISICLFHICDSYPFRNISSQVVTRTNSLYRVLYIAPNMHD